MRLFCSGVPVRSRRLWLQRNRGNWKKDDQQDPNLLSIPLFESSQPSSKGPFASAPVEVEQGLPALGLEVLDVLSLVQNEITPVLATEGLVVLQHQLVRRDTHVEGIGLGPALRSQEKAADGGVKRKERIKKRYAKVLKGHKSRLEKRAESQKKKAAIERGGKRTSLRKGPKSKRGISVGQRRRGSDQSHRERTCRLSFLSFWAP